MVRKGAVIFSLLFAILNLRGATDTSQRTFSERVRTLQVYSVSDRLSTGAPVIVLDGGGEIVISFDMLEDDRRYLRYEVIHCNADWQPSTLSYSEYLDGFNEGTIDDYEFSTATTVPYVHYRLSLPNENMNFMVSGNYLVRIYDENTPDNTLLQARFSVSEQTAPVAAFVTSRTDVGFNKTAQQLEISVDCSRTDANDLFSEVFTVLEQNGRPDTRRVLPKPLRLSGRTMIYEHQPELIYEGGNEYRRFETVANTWNGMHVDRVSYLAPYYNHFLETDEPRAFRSYLYDRTLNGGYVVREYNSENSDAEADYVVVHFTLEMPQIYGSDIFIDSDAFNRVLGQESLMKYNEETGRYEKAALLKQGAYSYQYVAVPQGTRNVATSTVEGNFYQTGNQYSVSVYSRKPGDRYDRLIGHVKVLADR